MEAATPFAGLVAAARVAAVAVVGPADVVRARVHLAGVSEARHQAPRHAVALAVPALPLRALTNLTKPINGPARVGTVAVVAPPLPVRAAVVTLEAVRVTEVPWLQLRITALRLRLGTPALPPVRVPLALPVGHIRAHIVLASVLVIDPARLQSRGALARILPRVPPAVLSVVTRAVRPLAVVGLKNRLTAPLGAVACVSHAAPLAVPRGVLRTVLVLTCALVVR